MDFYCFEKTFYERRVGTDVCVCVCVCMCVTMCVYVCVCVMDICTDDFYYLFLIMKVDQVRICVCVCVMDICMED